MAKYETVNVSPKCKIIIDSLANKFEMSKVDFVENMVIYFDKTGLNPLDVKVLTVSSELNQLRDTVISFIRKQEKDYISPTIGKMDILMARFMEYIENEAPIRGKYESTTKNKKFLLNKEDDQEISIEKNTIQKDTNLDDTSIIKEDYKKLELKYSYTKTYLENILKNTSLKSTGLSKKPVIELPNAEVEQYKEFLRSL